MPHETNLSFWLILWLVVAPLIFLVRIRRKVIGSGLLFAYVFNLWALHWLAASLYVLPWYSGDWLTIWYRGYHFGWTEDGFKLSTYGIIAFTLGSLFLAPLLLEILPNFKQEPPALLPDRRLPRIYIMTGLGWYFILAPLAKNIPTISQFLMGGLNLAATGLALASWSAWQEKNHRGFYRILFLGILSFPFLTLITQGFVSFGAAAVLGALAFVASFFRPRWKLFFLMLLVSYVGLSSYVTYMRDREPIRDIVWGKESYMKRINRLYLTATTLEWFDLHNENHLRRIDMRLNQNLLVGAAMENVPSQQPYVHGETFWTALITLVPRAIWPEKPVVLGGSSLASRFTGLDFGGEATTIGIGEIMEFYVNFGFPGVIVGFVVMGAVVTLFDTMARKYLLSGNWGGFTVWFLPGLSLVQVHDSLVAVTGGAGVGIAVALFLNYVLIRFRGRRIFLEKRSA